MYSNPFGGMAQRPSGAMYGQQQTNANPYQQMAQRRQPAQGQGGFGGFGGGGGGFTGQITAPTGTGGYDTRMPNPGSFNPYAPNAQSPSTGGGFSIGTPQPQRPSNPYTAKVMGYPTDYNSIMSNMNQMGQMLGMSGTDPNQMQYAMQQLMSGRSMDDIMKRLQSQWSTQATQNSNQYGPQYPAYLSGYGW